MLPFFCFFFFSSFLFLLHLARGCAKKPYFYMVFLHTLLKHQVPSCSNKEVKPKLPQKKVHIFFGNPFFHQMFFFKNTNFAPPPENCAQKYLQKPYFYRLKKNGQVIDSIMAKLLTLKWPKNGQVIDPTAYIYIYISVFFVVLLYGPSFGV